MKEKYRVVYTPRGAAREYSELALNLATGCENGCKYCYAPSTRRMSREDFHGKITLRKNVLNQLRLDLEEMSQLKDNRRVLLCFITDPYQPALQDLTRKALTLFRKYDIAFQVLTKVGSAAKKDFDLYSQKDAYATTIVFDNEKTRQAWEPKADSIEERIESLKKAKEAGIETWLSLEPVIYPEQALRLIDMTKKYVDHYKVGKVNNFPLDFCPDWRTFTKKVVDKLEAEEKSYYIKHSLRPYLPRNRRVEMKAV